MKYIMVGIERVGNCVPFNQKFTSQRKSKVFPNSVTVDFFLELYLSRQYKLFFFLIRKIIHQANLSSEGYS